VKDFGKLFWPIQESIEFVSKMESSKSFQ